MKAHVERDFIRGDVLVWILGPYSHGTASRAVLRLTADGPRWEDTDPGAVKDEIEPTLRLPYDVAEAIAPALLELTPPNTAQAEALADTRGVRDRLFTLVERLADAPARDA